MTEIEIADKLYVSFNGWYVKLTCTRDHRVVTIYLNPQSL
jgi:hypothetical protein